MKTPTIACALMSSTLWLTACESMPPHADEVKLANPASSYCITQGGTLSIKSETGGQVGYCTLPNGDVIEEWKLYRKSKAAQHKT